MYPLVWNATVFRGCWVPLTCLFGNVKWEGRKQSARLGVLGLLDRFGDGLAGAGAEESLLVVSQCEFPR